MLLLPAVVIAPWPHRAGFLLAAVGLWLVASGSRRRWVNRGATALAAGGVMIIAQALAMVTYRHLTARFPDLPGPLTHLLRTVATLAGIDAVADGPLLVMDAAPQVQPFAATWGLLADPVSVCFAAGGLILIVFRGAGARGAESRGVGGKTLAALLLTMAVWLPVRAVLLLGVYLNSALRTDYGVELDALGSFWNPWVQLGLALVPAAVLARITGPYASGATASHVAEPLWSRRLYSGAIVATWATFLVTASLLWEPVGQRNAGRVVIDDYHSRGPWPKKNYDTTRTDKRYDTEWYGPGSSYNYACLYDYCSHFYELSRLEQAITDSALSRCDVLVLKLPSTPYSADERAAVRRFVSRGGGLLVIGDHTAVFGSGANLNELTTEYGFRFRYDCAFTIDTPFDQRFTPPLAPHPAIQHVPWLEFATGCTIDPGASLGTAVMCCSGLKSLGADYFYSNYFPPPKNRPQTRWGGFIQLWTTHHERGRIAAFSDSTIFSNFSLFEPGKTELMLGMLEWLNHANSAWDPRGLLLIAGAIGGWLAARRLRPGVHFWPVTFTAGALGWSMAVTGVRYVHEVTVALPGAVRPMVQVAMDRTVSEARLPRRGNLGGTNSDFGFLEQAILRVGYFFKRLDGAPASGPDLIVIPYPNQKEPAIVRQYADALERYVKGGGKLLILDAPENIGSVANSLVYGFDLSVKRVPGTNASQLSIRQPWPELSVDSALEVRGGIPFAWLHGRPVAVWRPYGDGLVCLLGFASEFLDSQLGTHRDATPSDDANTAYQFLFILLRAVVQAQMPSDGPMPAVMLPRPPRTNSPPFRADQMDYGQWLRSLTNRSERLELRGRPPRSTPGHGPPQKWRPSKK